MRYQLKQPVFSARHMHAVGRAPFNVLLLEGKQAAVLSNKRNALPSAGVVREIITIWATMAVQICGRRSLLAETLYAHSARNGAARSSREWNGPAGRQSRRRPATDRTGLRLRRA